MAISTYRGGRSRFTILVLVVLSITLLTVDFRDSSLVSSVRGVALDLFAPVKSAAHTAFRPIANTWHGVVDYSDVKKENDRLRSQLAEQKGAVLQATDALNQRNEVLDLANVDRPLDVKTVVARVVSDAPSNFDQTIELDQGEGGGIKVGMPVATGAGLVGRVVEVTGHRSLVRLLTDPRFAVAVKLPTSGDQGLLKGRGPDRDLEIDLVSEKSTAKVGDAVLTSGEDGSLFPAELPIGTIATAQRDASSLQLQLTAKHSADLNHLSYVKVLLWSPSP